MTVDQIRLIKRVLAVVLVGFGAVVGYQLMRGFGAERTAPQVELLAENPTDTKARGVEISRLDEDGQKVFELTAAESVGRSEDVQTFKDVEIRFAAGESDQIPLIVTGDLCQYNTVSSEVHLEGNVVVRDDEDLHIEAPTLNYGSKPKRVWTDDPMRFSRGRLEGTSQRFQYLVVGNAFELDGGVAMTFRPEEGPAVQIQSDSARIRRRDKFVRFVDDVRVRQADRRLRADQLQIHLTDDENGITRIDAEGAVRMSLEVAEETGGEEASGSRPLEGPGRKHLASQNLVIVFRPDGSTLRSMRAVDKAKLTLEPLPSSQGTAMRRELEGDVLLFQFDPEGRLMALNGRGGVALTLTPEKRGAEEVRRMTAKRMTSRFDPETGDIRSARCAESVTFTHGDVQAEAEQGVYSADKELLTLTESPRLRNASSELTADKVDIHVVSGDLDATGSVRSTMKSTESSSQMTFLPGSEDEAVYFLSDRLHYDRAKDSALYTGTARGLRGTNRVEADTIELGQSKGELRATDNVRTTLAQKVTGDTEAPPRLTLTRAQHLFYRSEDGVLKYGESVEMKSDELVLRGDRVDVNLEKGGGTVREIDAEGKVEIESAQGKAAGEKATYVPVRQEVHVSGEHATLQDGDKLTEGKELTFFLADDKIFVDGREERRTKTTYSGSRPF
jgi:LPS export ABC transporter protein LptC/lipopolysaccharide transport protein LptA